MTNNSNNHSCKKGRCYNAKIPGCRRIHCKLHDRLEWYCRWQHNKYRPHVHWGVVVILLVLIVLQIFTLVTVSQEIRAAVPEIKKPAAFTDPSPSKSIDAGNAFDISTGGDKTTNAITPYDESRDPSLLYHTWASATQSYSALTLNVLYSADAGYNDTYWIDYSVNGVTNCSDYSTRTWNSLVAATPSSTTKTTAFTSLGVSQDLTKLCVKISSNKTGSPDNVDIFIYDIWTSGTFTVNSAPILGYTSDNVLGTVTQETDGSGQINIPFRIKDVDAPDTSTFVSGSAQYQVDGGGFTAVPDGSISFDSTPFSSATDFSGGTVYTLTWSSQDQISTTDSSTVDFRFKVNDDGDDSAYGEATGFSVDNVAPAFTVQYYSDAGLTSSLGNNPRLKAGTYYLKITSDDDLQSTPTISIDAEGTGNDVTNAVTVLVSGNDYKYTRTITYDVSAVGSVLENISMSGTDTTGNVSTNVNPTDEASKAAYTDTIRPSLSTWNLDVDAATAALNFDESVDASTLDVTAITIQDAVTATTSYTLTDSTTSSSSGVTIIIDLSITDINAIKADTGLATSASNTYITMTSAAIDDLAGNDVVAIPNGTAVQVYTADTTPPVLQSFTSSTSDGTYGSGSNINITATYNEPLDASSTLTVALNNTASATLSTVSGLTVYGTYTVGSLGEDVTDLTVSSISSEDVVDTANNMQSSSSVLGSPYNIADTSNINISTTDPAITNVTSSTIDGCYGAVENISIQIVFDDTVTVNTIGGTPSLALDSGGTANYSSGTGSTTLTFAYTVGGSDNSFDLDYTSTSALSLNGGTIKNGIGNDADLTLPTPGAAGSLGANKNISIDTVPPTFQSFTSSVSDGDYGPTSPINITATYTDFSSPLDVASTLTVILNNTASAILDTVSGLTVSGTYTVGATGSDQGVTDLTVSSISSESVIGGCGNPQTSSIVLGSPYNIADTSDINVDVTAPVLQSFSSITGNGTYGPGSSINITAFYNENLGATSTLTVVLSNGESVTLNNVSGSNVDGAYIVGIIGSGQDVTDLTVNSISSESVNDDITNSNTQTSSSVPISPYNIADTRGINVDVTLPTAPGNLTDAGIAAPTSLTLNFGSVSSDTNFDQYKIFYKANTGGVAESDTPWTTSNDLNLGFIDYSSASSTTVTGLSASTDYFFNIWAFDVAGNNANATEIGPLTTTSGNSAPTGTWNSATQKTDGSGGVDISIEVNDVDGDGTKAKIEYETDSDGACNGPWSVATLLGPATADFSDTGGVPDVNNANTYQVGSTATTRIITSSGSNTVQFDWDSNTDLPNANGAQCLRLTVNDDSADSTLRTQTVSVDNVDPVAPGTPDMTVGTDSGLSSTDNITSDTTPNFTVSCETNATVTLRIDTVNDNTATCVGGTTTITIGALTSGTYAIDAFQTDALGNVSTDSANLSVTIDTAPPTGLALTAGTTGVNDQVLNWTAVTETNFDHYEIWYGTNQTKVQNRDNSGGDGASEWDNTDDSAMATISTTSTTITGLTVSTTYYFKAWAIDDAGNEQTVSDINTTTLSGNNAPDATAPSPITQSIDGLGYVSFSTTVSDADGDTTKLKVEYSDDGGVNFYDAELVSVSAESGTVSLDNSLVYQIGSTNTIDTDSFSSIGLGIVWDSQSTSNGNGPILGFQSDIQLRVIPNDFTDDGSAAMSSSFKVDNGAPDIIGTTVSPSTGTLSVGETVTITLDADGEKNLSVGECTVNGVDVSSSFIDLGTTYTVTYTAVEGNTDWSAGSLPINCELVDSFGNSTTTTAFTDSNTLAGDANSPVVSEVTPPSPTNISTPDFTFNTTEAVDITYGGSCSSATTVADIGANTVTFNALDDGTYSDCTIKVTDSAGNESGELAISSFTINTTPVLIPEEEVTPGGVSLLPGTFLPPVSPEAIVEDLIPRGFRILINDGDAITNSPNVTLTLSGGPDVRMMALSSELSFKGVGQEPYQQTKQWDICSRRVSSVYPVECPEDIYTVHAKFYTQFGVSSETVSDSIIYTKAVAVIDLFVRSLSRGIQGDDVKLLQEFLADDPDIYPEGLVTGFFGRLTQQAVRRFQARHDLIVDGIFGPNTRQKLEEVFGVAPPEVSMEIPQVLFTQNLQRGMRHPEVTTLQELLATDKDIYPEGLITGFFGSLTERAVGRFQLRYGVVETNASPGWGQFGPRTRAFINALIKEEE